MSELKLSDVIARHVPVEWHEGVAVVRAVAERLLATEGSSRAIPELQQVVLYPTGQLDVSGGAAVDEPVRRMGQLLQAMLGTADPPVQLRLVVSQATAPTPGFTSIEDFDAALGYYERPNRQAVLQDLYARAAAAPAPTDAQPTPELDTIAPLPTGKLAARREARKPKGKLRRGPLVAAIVLVAIAAGSLYYLKTIGFTTNGAEVGALTQRASSAVGTAIVSGVSAVTERVGLGRLVSPDAPPSPAPTGPANATDTKPAVIRSGKRTLLALDLDPKFTTGLPTAPVPSGVRPDDPPPVAVEEDDGPIGDSQIYSPNSAGVTPPVTKRMQLPRELPAGVAPRDLGRVDLIIGPDGMVDSVRLVGAPRNVLDSLWLSAIKAWEFEPALKDGVPVRYRKTVWIATQ